MRYVIVDQEGASRAHLASPGDLLLLVDEIVREDPEVAEDLYVLNYDDSGRRVDPPIELRRFVSRSVDSAAIAVVLSTSAAVAASYGPAGMVHSVQEDLQPA